MANIVFPHTLTDGQVARASEVMANFQAISAIVNGALEAVNLSDSSVSTGKLQAASVTTSKLDDAAVTAAKIADEAVTTSRLADAAVTTSKIFGQAVTNEKLGNLSISSGKLQDGAVIHQKIAEGAVQADNIFTHSVTSDKIANGAVTSAKLADDAVSGQLFGGNTHRLLMFRFGARAEAPGYTGTPNLPTGWSITYPVAGGWRVNTTIPREGNSIYVVMFSGSWQTHSSGTNYNFLVEPASEMANVVFGMVFWSKDA